MATLDILVIGDGGREHALVWKLAQSPHVGRLFAAPGNGGTEGLVTNVRISAENIDNLLGFARRQGIDLTIVGPEIPLAAGIVDIFHGAGLRIFGPTRRAAMLESSKAFARAFMDEAGIAGAAYRVFDDYQAARRYVRALPLDRGVVVKASGLAAGEGVLICDNVPMAEIALRDIMIERRFGHAGDEVVIEERLAGPELSVLAFTDGQTVVPMLPARDHKRVFAGDLGPNTGGMGAYAPPADVDATLLEEVGRTVLERAVHGMAARDLPYVGVLYAGLMLTDDGPRVLEFNCRFGDPETQAILPLLDGDLVEIMLACLDGTLAPDQVRRHPGAAVTVVMAASGYPGPYPKGLPIEGLDQVPEDVLLFHAGTRREHGRLYTTGGRVLAATGLGDDVAQAAQRAYAGIAPIRFSGAHYRDDIGRTATP